MTHRDQTPALLDGGRPDDEIAVEADTGNAGVGQWGHRITFTWSGGPLDAQLRSNLTEIGVLEDLCGGDYALTIQVWGDPGPGTAEERAGRAAWITVDALMSLLDSDQAACFLHRSTELVDSHDPAPGG